jgi:hypothetical protein
MEHSESFTHKWIYDNLELESEGLAHSKRAVGRGSSRRFRHALWKGAKGWRGEPHCLSRQDPGDRLRPTNQRMAQRSHNPTDWVLVVATTINLFPHLRVPSSPNRICALTKREQLSVVNQRRSQARWGITELVAAYVTACVPCMVQGLVPHDQPERTVVNV